MGIAIVILLGLLIIWLIGGIVTVRWMSITPEYTFKGDDYFIGFIGSWLTLYALTNNE